VCGLMPQRSIALDRDPGVLDCGARLVSAGPDEKAGAGAIRPSSRAFSMAAAADAQSRTYAGQEIADRGFETAIMCAMSPWCG
jgi:hypothetical protein